MNKKSSTELEAPASRHNEVIAFLNLCGHGEMLDAIADDTRAVEKAVSETGKAGTLTIKIKIAPNGANKRIITYDVSKKVATIPTMQTYAFATQQGQYVENDPDQRQLDLTVVPVEPKQFQQVNG